MNNASEYSTASGIRRISEDRTQWRVSVETWPQRDGYEGRLVFSPDRTSFATDKREGPVILRGRTREDVIAEAYTQTEERLKRLLRSLG